MQAMNGVVLQYGTGTTLNMINSLNFMTCLYNMEFLSSGWQVLSHMWPRPYNTAVEPDTKRPSL